MSTDQAKDAQARHQHALLSKRNVVGVGVGYKESHGVNTGDIAVVVLVEQKKPKAALSDDDLIPPELEGLRTDVLEVGDLRALQTARDRYRPIIPSGVSIGHYKVTAGTLGTIVKDKNTGEFFLLSNNHVLANSNDALIGDPILQPAPMDGGVEPNDVVAKLERYVKILFTDDPAGIPPIVQPPPAPPPTEPTEPTEPIPPGDNPPPTPPPTRPGGLGCDILGILLRLLNGAAAAVGSERRVVATTASALAAAQAVGGVRWDRYAAQASVPENRVDCALGRPLDAAMFSDDIKNIGIVNEAKAPALGMRVRKYGRTTEYTEGNITLLNATVNITYNTERGPRIARFVGQCIAQGMSQGGDSGSLVVDTAENKAVGLLFAGSPMATIFTPIEMVLDALSITL